MTKKRRYLICAAILAACVCIALGGLALLPPGASVTKANFDRLEKRMTRADVEKLLGEPTGGYLLGGSFSTSEDHEYRWCDNDGIASIRFAKNPNDEHAPYAPPGMSDQILDLHWESSETFTDKFRRLLRLAK
jgi:hypothetical protein